MDKLIDVQDEVYSLPGGFDVTDVVDAEGLLLWWLLFFLFYFPPHFHLYSDNFHYLAGDPLYLRAAKLEIVLEKAMDLNTDIRFCIMVALTFSYSGIVNWIDFSIILHEHSL